MRCFRPATGGVWNFPVTGITFALRMLGACAVGLTTWAGPGILFQASLLAAEPRNLLLSDEMTRLNILDQNWMEHEANWFYGVPQRSKLIPYAWFLHLEQADSETLFRDAANIPSLGYLPRVPGGPENPDSLPIGFARDGNHLGFTCAACHTNQINYQGQAWLVDGAPTLADFEEFLTRLTEVNQHGFLRGKRNAASQSEQHGRPFTICRVVNLAHTIGL